MNRPSNPQPHTAHTSMSADKLLAHQGPEERITLALIRIADQLESMADMAKAAQRDNDSTL